MKSIVSVISIYLISVSIQAWQVLPTKTLPVEECKVYFPDSLTVKLSDSTRAKMKALDKKFARAMRLKNN